MIIREDRGGGHPGGRRDGGGPPSATVDYSIIPEDTLTLSWTIVTYLSDRAVVEDATVVIVYGTLATATLTPCTSIDDAVDLAADLRADPADHIAACTSPEWCAMPLTLTWAAGDAAATGRAGATGGAAASRRARPCRRTCRPRHRTRGT